jgi:flagellar basal body-associated protein FliL
MAKKKKSAPAETDGEAEGGKKSKKKLIVLVLLCASLAGAGYKLGGGGASAEGVATTTTIVQLEGCKEGTDATDVVPNVVDLPKMNLNLADGHYLSVAVSLNLCPDVLVTPEAPMQTAPAKDIIVSTLSGSSMAVLQTPEGRDEARKLLLERLSEEYEEIVYGLFFVEFVMQ